MKEIMYFTELGFLIRDKIILNAPLITVNFKNNIPENFDYLESTYSTEEFMSLHHKLKRENICNMIEFKDQFPEYFI